MYPPILSYQSAEAIEEYTSTDEKEGTHLGRPLHNLLSGARKQIA